MKLQFVEKYKGYTLNCAPQATHDGGFLAFVIITHGIKPVQVDRAAVLDLGAFELQSEAALAALSAAIRWVDEETSLQAESPDTRDVALDASSLRVGPPAAGPRREILPIDAYLLASRSITERRAAPRHAHAA
ncbi:MAG: hypothetical protein ABI887_13235 [Burkholderiales bacterium]